MDLDPFNEEAVADRIYTFHGLERAVLLADFVVNPTLLYVKKTV